MRTREVQSGTAWLHAEALGNPEDPCVILVMGAQASLLWWPTEFCEALVKRKHYVLRFDHRDTGLSSKYPVGTPPYTADDLADDVIAVLDAFGIRRAQLVGVSMGGMIGQIVALKHPGRLSGLFVMSATPLNGVDLPGPSEQFREVMKRGEDVDWDDREQAVNYLLDFGRVLAVTTEDFDEAGARALVEKDFDRSHGLSHGTNHFLVQGEEEWAPRLPELKVPLVVLHGRRDPLFPLEHGRALARAVRDAKFVELPGGHGLATSAWQPLFDALNSTTRGSPSIPRHPPS
jgi:pimeloyl-ACP methyl ester carboxylesterase